MRPGLTVFTDGPRLDGGAAGCSVGMEERAILRRAPRPTWAATRRPAMQSAPLSPAALETGIEKTDETKTGHELHRRTGD